MGNKTCPSKLKCEKCYWYRPWNMTNAQTGQVKQEMRCSIDVLLEYIPQIAGSIDGCQRAANETRNYVLKLAMAFSQVGLPEIWKSLQYEQNIKQIDVEEIGDGTSKSND